MVFSTRRFIDFDTMNFKDHQWTYNYDDNDGDKQSNPSNNTNTNTSSIVSQLTVDSADASDNHRTSPPLPPLKPQQSHSSIESEHDIPPKYGGPVRQPNSNDVLSGRGRHIDTHDGNVYFRHLVATYRETYLSPDTKKRDKVIIANQLVKEIRNMNPAGRFLEKDKADGRWYEIGDVRARKKAGQAMREKKTSTFDVDMFLDKKPSASSSFSSKSPPIVDEQPSSIPSNMTVASTQSHSNSHSHSHSNQQHESSVQHQEPKGIIPPQIQSSWTNTINNAQKNFQQKYSHPLNMNLQFQYPTSTTNMPLPLPMTSMPTHISQQPYAQYPTRVQSAQIPDRPISSKTRELQLQSLDEEHSIHGAPTPSITTPASTTTTTSSFLQQDHLTIYNEKNKTLQDAEEIIKGGELFNKTTSSVGLAKLLYPDDSTTSGRMERGRLTREGSSLTKMEELPRIRSKGSPSSSSSSSPSSRRSLLGTRDDMTNSSSSSLQRADTYEINERPPLYSRNSSQGSNTSLFSIPIQGLLDDHDSNVAMTRMNELDFSVKSSSSSIHSSIMSYESEFSNTCTDCFV